MEKDGGKLKGEEKGEEGVGGVGVGRHEPGVVFLRSATKGLRAVTTDNCNGMPAPLSSVSLLYNFSSHLFLLLLPPTF